MAEGRTTPLYDWHLARGARMVAFAGWQLPIQYPTGIIEEHKACRERAALFDVSHMGQVTLPGDPDAAARALESLAPGNFTGLKPGRTTYSLLLTDDGTIEDDFMASRLEDGWLLVINAGRTASDLAFMETRLPPAHRPVLRDERALLALQGPLAEAALVEVMPEVHDLRFRDTAELFFEGQPCRVARLGYTGEDGFEIDLPGSLAPEFATRLATDERVTPAGLGARDSLRLEAGLCLYGHDIDTTTTPVAAGLDWTINKRRREAADFPGAARILNELQDGPAQRLVGLTLEGRLPAREGALVFAGEEAVGRVTSGGFAPTVGQPIALAYIRSDLTAPGTQLVCQVRQHSPKATVTALPFVPHRYHR
ncbi:MAG: glycine cleavage system aminomethyltransferase GcvT [Pseudomonadota bacterium]